MKMKKRKFVKEKKKKKGGEYSQLKYNFFKKKRFSGKPFFIF